MAIGTPVAAQVLFNADVQTMDDEGRTVEAIAWRDGRIVAVGSRADVLHAAGPMVQAWDASGRTVLPGFIDAHQHPCIEALYGGGAQLSPPAVTDIASLQKALAESAAATPSGAWVNARAWDEALLAERRPPNLRELDEAVPDHPLFALDYTGHRALANSRALALAGLGRDTPDPPGGAIARQRGGAPDGLLIERGMSRVETLARAALRSHELEGFLERLGQHFQRLVRVGITRVVDAAVPGDMFALYRLAEARGLICVPTVLMPVSTSGYLEVPWDVLEQPPTGTREGLLSVGPVKLVLDGAPACAMCVGWWQLAGAMLCAWSLAVRRGSLDPLRIAFSGQPSLGRRVRSGIRIYAPDEAKEFVARAAAQGFAVASHSEGNEAVEMALDAYRAAGPALQKAGVPRLEHLLFVDRELVARAADAGAAAVVQPHFLSLPALSAAPGIPGMRTKPLRWLLDHGVTVAGSSDFPVVGYDPLPGVRCAVERRDAHGRVREPDQRISLHEAFALYTRGSARASGCLDECGSLEPGKRADIVVLSQRVSASEQLENTQVRATIVGGALAFGELA